MRVAGNCDEESLTGRATIRLASGVLALSLLAQIPAGPLAAQSIAPDNTTQTMNSGVASAADGLPPDISTGDPVVTYENHQNSFEGVPPDVGSLEEFMGEDAEHNAMLGLTVAEDSRSLQSGQKAEGLLVTKVAAGSPAAQAGLKAYFHPVKRALEAAAVVGSFVTAVPIIVLVPVMEASHVGESYDLIIGIDGARVTTSLAMQDCMRDVMPGETVYLSLIRNGRRVQLPVQIPLAAHAPE